MQRTPAPAAALCAAILASIGALPRNANAQCLAHEQTILTAAQPITRSRFARSLAASGDTIVVGASGQTTTAPPLGSAVHIYTRVQGQWVEQTTLVPPPGSGGGFGHAVAIHNNTIIVAGGTGANSPVPFVGQAHVYRFDGTNWTLQATLIPANVARNDAFGSAVSIHGNFALIGAPGKNTQHPASGGAYIFHFDGLNWIEQTELIPPNGGPRESFGNAVSISGNTAVIGAYNHDNRGLSFPDGNGATYIYNLNAGQWSLQTQLISPDPIPGERDRFGRSVSLDGDTLLVGTEPITTANLFSPKGSAYVFRNVAGQWLPEAKLLAHDGSGGDRFGFAVSLKDNIAIIGAWGVALGPGCPFPRTCDDGAAYLFERNLRGWSEVAKLRSSNLAERDTLGWAVAATQTYVVAGAWRSDTVAPDAGAAYVFTINGICCYADCDQSTGPGALDIFDFLCFQDAFVAADPYACDCDVSTGNGVCDIFDFLCFQNAFVNGCP